MTDETAEPPATEPEASVTEHPAEPPAPQVHTLGAQVPLVPVPQTFDVEGGQWAGNRVALITLTSPMAVAVAALDEGGARALCAQILDVFGPHIEVADASALEVIQHADELARQRAKERPGGFRP